MVKATLNLVILLTASVSFADAGMKVSRSQLDLPKIIKVAVIDTGIDPSFLEHKTDYSLCESGHKDFTATASLFSELKEDITDHHGHGTHISGIIDQYAKDFILIKNGSGKDLAKHKVAYCQIILKYYDPKILNTDNLKNTIAAFRWAIDQKVDIINYSGGGTEFSQAEHDVVMEALSKGIKVVAAAGNEHSNIDKHKYYPAMYDKRIYVVGNLVKPIVKKPSSKRDDDIAPSSNWGLSVNTWELGTNVISRLPAQVFGYMTGTSQATAIKSGKLVREMLSTK
jgi:subtilisin family serine protease